MRRRVFVLVVLAAAVGAVAVVLAFRGGSSHRPQPAVTGGDDANVMRGLQRPKLVRKAP